MFTIVGDVLIMTFLFRNSVFASSSNQYDSNFLSSTNTYDAALTQIDAQVNKNMPKYNKVQYQLSSKNGNEVANEEPQVTFITHGLSGDASHWSNDSVNGNYDFSPSYNSIIDLSTQRNLYIKSVL